MLPQPKPSKTGTTIFSVMTALAQQHRAINLSQGFPNFDCPDQLKELVNKHMSMGHNQYAPMPGLPELLEVLSEKIKQLYSIKVDAQKEITITAGGTQALFTAIAALVYPGDEVILFEPAYDSYAPSIEIQGGKPVPYALQAPGYRVNWQEVEALLTARTRMIIVNTPHNPCARVFRKEDMLELQRLAVEHDLLVLSDEVYEHILFDGLKHHSAMCFPELYARSLVVFSFGKVFNNTGWKMGYCVAPPHLTERFRQVHQFNVFSVNRPIQHALAEYMQDPEVYAGINTLFERLRNTMYEVLEDTPFKALPCEGTYFMLCDYSAVSDMDDLAFAKWLTVEHGLASIPLSPFYTRPPENSRIIRLCFAKTEEVLHAAGKVLSFVYSRKTRI